VIKDLIKAEQRAERDNTQNQTVRIMTPGMWLQDQGIVFEQIEGEKFLLSNGETVACYPKTINTDYIPLPKEKINWNLSSLVKIKPVDKQKLWSWVKQFIYRSVDLPDERLYDVLTAWVFATYIPELWITVPYVFFTGTKNSGKTRGLETLQVLTFRGKISVSSTAPALFRSIEKYNCVPFLDEAEVYNQEEKTDVVACLNAGYKRRSAIVERCQGDHGNEDISTFHVFGFKGIAGTESLKATLESRSIIIKMSRNNRPLDIVINDNMAQLLRNQLLLWRFETLLNYQANSPQNQTVDSELYDTYDSYDTCDSKTKPSLDLPTEFKNMRNSRVIELFLPLYEVSDDTVKKTIIEYAKVVDGHQKQEETTSLEAEIIIAVLQSHDKMVKGIIPRTVIELIINRDRPPNGQLKEKQLAVKLTALGFEQGRISSVRGIKWDAGLLFRLCERYEVDATEHGFICDVNSLGGGILQKVSQVSQVSQASLETDGFDLFSVKSCVPLSKEGWQSGEKCHKCGYLRTLNYHVEFFDSKKEPLDVCASCGNKIISFLNNRMEEENS
jgi:hypothetical protein